MMRKPGKNQLNSLVGQMSEDDRKKLFHSFDRFTGQSHKQALEKREAMERRRKFEQKRLSQKKEREASEHPVREQRGKANRIMREGQTDQIIQVALETISEVEKWRDQKMLSETLGAQAESIIRAKAKFESDGDKLKQIDDALGALRKANNIVNDKIWLIKAQKEDPEMAIRFQTALENSRRLYNGIIQLTQTVMDAALRLEEKVLEDRDQEMSLRRDIDKLIQQLPEDKASNVQQFIQEQIEPAGFSRRLSLLQGMKNKLIQAVPAEKKE
jgi:hypothetical protein